MKPRIKAKVRRTWKTESECWAKGWVDGYLGRCVIHRQGDLGHPDHYADGWNEGRRDRLDRACGYFNPKPPVPQRSIGV